MNNIRDNFSKNGNEIQDLKNAFSASTAMLDNLGNVVG